MEALQIAPGESGYMNLTVAERHTIQHIERLGASISLVGVCLIFITYGFFSRVRTIPNTFIFFASIANIGASIACLIGYAGILAGDDSAMCQTQAFLLEMFMQSDPWWSFAMAVNVYMVFFLSYSPNEFHKHLWLYCLICYGIPAVPAFVCLFYAPNGKRMYGNATLWCWIDDSYNQLRIFTYYLPIWTCISLSAVIYVAVGYQVFHQRNQLRNLTLSNHAKDTYGINLKDSAEKGQQCYGTVTTEVQVTAESSGSQTPPSTPEGSIAPVLHKSQAVAAHSPWGSPDYGLDSTISPTAAAHNKPFTTISSISSNWPREAKKKQSILKTLAQTWRKFTNKLGNLDPIKLAYLRTSFVFAISILVTWTPSSINRVYSLIHPTRTSYGLNLAGAIVLPLQGLWNAIIFAATSWNILKDEFGELRRGRWPGFRGHRRVSEDRGKLPAAAATRHGTIPLEERELPPLGAMSSRTTNVRVIRGGSL
ncbi:putative G-protein coupled receptor [Achaetomium macrosporum]|uniref:G-protein coupled receptor n=1 Tax=Achaetomium macrosporum TaxID=79813 RepID=A0AAN7CD84_9PEZI|nr:putative G-protein coupled receptor [Achaetomium macrosporum]